MSSDQEMEEQVEVPKRGRGRPKKTDSKVVKKVSEESKEPPAKRGRGRQPASAPKEKAEKAPKASKAKKTDSDAGNADVEDAAKAAPKRRGRQPKSDAASKKKKPEPEESEEEEEDDAEEMSDNEAVPAPPAKANGSKGDSQKAAKNGHAKEDEEDEDDAEEEAEDEKTSEKSDAASTSDSRIKIVVEHCKSCHTYRRKADDIISALKEKWSNIDVEYNPKPPRKGSFEIDLIGHNGSDHKLWTGFELGPPRKLKFPDPDIVVEAMEKVYVPESA